MTTPSIEQSHGGDYVTRTRLSDLETVDADAERRRNHGPDGRFVPRNDAGREHGAHRELTKDLRAIRDAVQAAAGGVMPSQEAREVVATALVLYGASRRSLGQRSPVVIARLLRAAVNDALAGHFTAQAALAGFSTPRGLELIDAAHRCESRAERATTAALAFAKAIQSKPRGGKQDVPWLVQPSSVRHDGEDDQADSDEESP